MIKKIITLLIATLIFQTQLFAKTNEERVITSDQNIKVRVVNLIGGNKHSEKKLEGILISEQKIGWVYDYHVDIDNIETGYITKLFVFKRTEKK